MAETRDFTGSPISATQIMDIALLTQQIDLEALPDTPKWGDGFHAVLPNRIPVYTDAQPYESELIGWLVLNDFGKYDFTQTAAPENG